jgi:hypothetical protein
MATMAFPYVPEQIGRKTFMVSGAWDVLQLGFVIIFWIKTKGKTLEGIDEFFEDVRFYIQGGQENNMVVLHGVGSNDVQFLNHEGR